MRFRGGFGAVRGGFGRFGRVPERFGGAVPGRGSPKLNPHGPL